SARLDPIAHYEPTQFCGCTNGMTPLAAGSHAPPTHLRLESVDHHAAALTQDIARAPQVIAADAIEHGVDAIISETMNLLHKVRVLIVDGDPAQFPDYRGTPRRTCTVHLDPGQLRQLQHRGADTTGRTVDQHTLS